MRKKYRFHNLIFDFVMTCGITGIVMSTVMACRATLKVEDILDEAQDDLNDFNRGLLAYLGIG